MSDDSSPLPRRYRLTVAYDGSGFHGWQQQDHQTDRDGRPIRTVAGDLQSTLRRLLGQRLDVVGASRTDAGVHARGQVAQFDAAISIPQERLAMAMNAKLPEDIEVLEAEVAPEGFDAIADVTSKQYRYRLWTSPRRPLEKRRFVGRCQTELDPARMQDAAERLVGTHDLAGLAAASHGRSSTVRTIFDCRIETDDPEVHVVVEGDGFLYHTVRIIAGTLVEVGRGHFEPQRIDQILAEADRALAGPTLGPEGLWLEWVRYGERNEEAADA